MQAQKIAISVSRNAEMSRHTTNGSHRSTLARNIALRPAWLTLFCETKRNETR